jgi:hypothetical protein
VFPIRRKRTMFRPLLVGGTKLPPAAYADQHGSATGRFERTDARLGRTPAASLMPRPYLLRSHPMSPCNGWPSARTTPRAWQGSHRILIRSAGLPTSSGTRRPSGQGFRWCTWGARHCATHARGLRSFAGAATPIVSRDLELEPVSSFTRRLGGLPYLIQRTLRHGDPHIARRTAGIATPPSRSVALLERATSGNHHSGREARHHHICGRRQ